MAAAPTTKVHFFLPLARAENRPAYFTVLVCSDDSQVILTGKSGRVLLMLAPPFIPPSPCVVNKTQLLRHSGVRLIHTELLCRVVYPALRGDMLHVKATLALASGSRLLRPLVPGRARSTLTSAQARHDSPVQPVREAAAARGFAPVDFEETQEAYKSKDSLELLRSLVVFKLCSYDFLVDRNQEVSWCRFTVHVMFYAHVNYKLCRSFCLLLTCLHI